MFHHVRPRIGSAFVPNEGLEITPEFLDETLGALARQGFVIIGMDEAARRLREGETDPARPFAVLTFDDGYRNNVEHALPVLARHAARFTLYVTTGFADRTARLWWAELEDALRRLNEVAFGGETLPCATAAEKTAAFQKIYWCLREGPEERLLAEIARIASAAGISGAEIVERDCLDWPALAHLAQHELCTIGVHTLTHPRLAKHDEATVRRELAESRRIIETRVGCPARHLAYPVGDATSAGPREFAIARELGFETAVTTRKGMIFPEHARHLTALPRVSINGEWQQRAVIDMLLSGAPFLLWNRGRCLDVG
jgi:peptidoglycan/xylan/chitin deacetylase (PgdA/CDA1 family)